MSVKTIEWNEEKNSVSLIDQTRLPLDYVIREYRRYEEVAEAIKELQVRGAPAIGIAGAMGLGLAGARWLEGKVGDLEIELKKAAEVLKATRPTAVNLFWAIDRVMKKVSSISDPGEKVAAIIDEAREIQVEDERMCRLLGEHGAALVKDGGKYITHCNAGGLATSGYGTALAVFFSANEQNKKIKVFVDETRPLLQGSRLTAWELMEAGINAVLICDSAAAHVMNRVGVDAAFVGADRIAANGDSANKIGTYSLAVNASRHGVPFYVVAPSSTVDLELPRGEDIPIEERSPGEVTEGFGRRTAPREVNVYCPAFDVTPAELITGIITERGLISPPFGGPGGLGYIRSS